jgi:RNA polymerase sigma factor (sigma-70 family)
MATIAPEVPVLARDEAFEQLYRRYVKDVYHYALALLRNPADAEDVTQTTFMNAYRAFQRGDEILKPQNWLIKIAHNVARSRYSRINRRVKEVPLEEHLEQLAVPEEERPNVEGVLRALGRLPFNQRAALIMRELEGRPYSEIADTLGVSVAAVETLIFRARRSLRVRTAALRSILAVPLPSSLTQLVGGGGSAAAAGGIGAGFLIKTAIALVVGGLATGVGVERATQAEPLPRPDVATPAAQASVAAGHATVRPLKNQVHASRRTASTVANHARAVGTESTLRAAVVGTPSSSGQAVGAPSSAGSAQESSAPTPATTTAQAVQTVVDTAEEAVAAVSASVPVTVPQVTVPPVQLPPVPPVPKLP